MLFRSIVRSQAQNLNPSPPGPLSPKRGKGEERGFEIGSKNRLLIFAICLVVNVAPALQAGLTYRLDMDPGTSGIQSSRNVLASSAFQVALLLELDETTSLDSYRISTSFDASGLAYDMANPAVNIPLPNYTSQTGPPDLNLNTNIVGPFDAAANSINNGSVAPVGPTVIGLINFNASNNLGSFSIVPMEINGIDGSFDNGNDQIFPIFQGGTITLTAVPEPAALSGAAVLFSSWCLNRRRRTPKKSRSSKQVDTLSIGD